LDGRANGKVLERHNPERVKEGVLATHVDFDNMDGG